MSVTDAQTAGPALKAVEPTHAETYLLRYLHLLWKTMFNEPYRPERHYMRGPGPAYARKHSLVR
jgi:hypothetical protein